MDVNIYDSILVTLPAEIHAKYQSCMLEANAYNNTHAQYLQSYRANKERLELLRRNQIMFNALATLHIFRTLHTNTHTQHAMAPWIKNKLRLHAVRNSLFLQGTKRFSQYHTMQTHSGSLYALMRDHTVALQKLQEWADPS
jgi:hypothetical protein